MQQKTIYVDAQKRHLPAPVEGTVEMVELSAESGKVLVHPDVDGEWLVIAVEAVGGWSEIKPVPPEEEPTVEDKAEAYDILMGVDSE